MLARKVGLAVTLALIMLISRYCAIADGAPLNTSIRVIRVGGYGTVRLFSALTKPFPKTISSPVFTKLVSIFCLDEDRDIGLAKGQVTKFVFRHDSYVSIGRVKRDMLKPLVSWEHDRHVGTPVASVKVERRRLGAGDDFEFIVKQNRIRGAFPKILNGESPAISEGRYLINVAWRLTRVKFDPGALISRKIVPQVLPLSSSYSQASLEQVDIPAGQGSADYNDHKTNDFQSKAPLIAALLFLAAGFVCIYRGGKLLQFSNRERLGDIYLIAGTVATAAGTSLFVWWFI